MRFVSGPQAHVYFQFMKAIRINDLLITGFPHHRDF